MTLERGFTGVLRRSSGRVVGARVACVTLVPESHCSRLSSSTRFPRVHTSGLPESDYRVVVFATVGLPLPNAQGRAVCQQLRNVLSTALATRVRCATLDPERSCRRCCDAALPRERLMTMCAHHGVLSHEYPAMDNCASEPTAIEWLQVPAFPGANTRSFACSWTSTSVS